MTKGKIIVVEGTDCSGKKTQSEMLAERLTSEGEKSYYFGYPNYESPTGEIVGLPYLGKPWIARELINRHRIDTISKLKELYIASHKDKEFDEKLVNKTIDILADELGCGWFPEGAPNVPAKIAGAYYAIDRAYNAPKVESLLETGNVVMDRYIYSNMGHQGGKIGTSEERDDFYTWNAKLELEMFSLPEDDIRMFLHVPTIYTGIIKKSRGEELDEHEKDENHLRNAELAYLELASKYNFETIECLKKHSDPIELSDVKTIDEIHEEVYKRVIRKL